MLPAGIYYIGDLCFVLSDEEWNELISLTIKGENIIEGEHSFSDGRKFAIHPTKFGDGVYTDQYGESYCVESGSLGCILLSDIKHRKLFDFKSLGVIVEITGDFETLGRSDRKKWNGNILFGGVCINTNPNGWIDEYEDDQTS
jgi:hypothetical protein